MFRWLKKQTSADPAAGHHSSEHHGVEQPDFTDVQTSAAITDFAVSPDRLHAFSGDTSGRVVQWDLSTGKTLRSVQVSERPILATGAGADGLFVMVDHELLRLDTDLQVLEIRRIPCNGLFVAGFSADARLALLGCRDEGVQCIAPASFVPHRKHAHRPHDLSQQIQFDDGDVPTWLSRVGHHSSRPNRIALAEDNSFALTLSVHDDAFKFRVWSLEDGECRELQGYDGAFAIATDGRVGYSGRYCAAANMKSIVKFDLTTGEYIDSLNSHLDGHATALSVHASGDRLLLGFSGGTVAVVNVDQHFDHHSFKVLGRRAEAVTGVKFVGNDRVVSSSGDRIRCWPIKEAPT